MRANSIASRVAALGLLALVVLIVGVTLIQPLWEKFASNRELIGELESQLVRFMTVVGRESRLEEELENLKRQYERSGLMLKAKSAALASASLQERIKTVVDASGGTLSSTQVLVGETSGGIQRVSVNARMMGSMAEVQSSLYGLESTPPSLVVDDVLIVRRGASRRLRRQGGAFDDFLDVRFQVTGFYDARSTEN